ncbi:uncharacterized protein LOC100183080 [Ciona intestinalis]
MNNMVHYGDKVRNGRQGGRIMIFLFLSICIALLIALSYKQASVNMRERADDMEEKYKETLKTFQTCSSNKNIIFEELNSKKVENIEIMNKKSKLTSDLNDCSALTKSLQTNKLEMGIQRDDAHKQLVEKESKITELQQAGVEKENELEELRNTNAELKQQLDEMLLKVDTLEKNGKTLHPSESLEKENPALKEANALSLGLQGIKNIEPLESTGLSPESSESKPNNLNAEKVVKESPNATNTLNISKSGHSTEKPKVDNPDSEENKKGKSTDKDSTAPGLESTQNKLTEKNNHPEPLGQPKTSKESVEEVNKDTEVSEIKEILPEKGIKASVQVKTKVAEKADSNATSEQKKPKDGTEEKKLVSLKVANENPSKPLVGEKKSGNPKLKVVPSEEDENDVVDADVHSEKDSGKDDAMVAQKI